MAVTESSPETARKRKVDAFVFDCVCHVFNFDKANALGPPGELFDEHLYAFHQLLTREGEKVLSREEFFKEWSVDEIYDMVIEGSDTDMIAAQPLPLTDLFHDGLSPWEKCAEMAQKHPDRAVFWGSVNPLEGKKALDLMTRQVEDYGAKAFKFYNVRYDYGQPFPWRMDDPRIAYPVFERAQELGVNLIGVHKGVPLGPQPIEHTRTFDMDGAAANFPDINFVIFHVGLPWLDEVLWQIVRYPNLYASIAATVNFIARQPRVFAETLGKMMWWCGEDKIIYGGESPIWHPQWALEEFWNFELPRDIVEERGYPQLTDQAKRKILGENLAKLHGIDVEAKKAELGIPGRRQRARGRGRAVLPRDAPRVLPPCTRRAPSPPPTQHPPPSPLKPLDPQRTPPPLGAACLPPPLAPSPSRFSRRPLPLSPTSLASLAPAPRIPC